MKKNQYFALCLVGVVGSTQASSVFIDRDFDLDDYVVASHSNGGDTTVIVSNSSPGNPGTSIGHMTLVSANNPNHSSRNYFINSHFSWDPATQGNINTISASMDRWVAVEGGTLGSWGAHLLIQQAGNYYQYRHMITPVEENAWHRAKMQSLTESDFSLVIDLETAEMNANFHPDFSGSEMQFGYVTGWRHSGNAAVLIDNRVDNLRISISHDAAAESTLNLVKTLGTEAQSAYGVAYAEMTNTLWLQDHENDQLIQVTPEGAVLSSIELPSSSVSSHLDISVAPEALQLGRAEIDAGSILVFEGEGGITIMYGFDPVTGNQVSRQTTSFGEGFVVGGAYHPERGSFFLLQNNEAVSSDANVIAEISASDGSILNRIALASVATDFDVVSGDLEVGSNGNLYVLSSAEAAMLELTPTGALVQEIALPVTNVAFSGLALDTEAGDVWTTNTAGILQRFTDGQSTPGATESVAFLGAGNLYNSQADTMVYGNAEQETLLVSCNPTITVDANVERIELPGALADYQFSVQGTRIQITSTEAGTLSFLGLNQPVELVFADGAASLQLSGLSIATLNTQFLSSFAAAITTGLDAADVSKTASSEGCEN